MISNNVAAIILAAGSGTRSGLSHNKVLHNFGTATPLAMCLAAFRNASVAHILVAANESDINEIEKICLPFGARAYVGGKTRSDSVYNGLSLLEPEPPQIVLIHDGARPFISAELIAKAVACAIKEGCAITAIPATSTIYNQNQNSYPCRSHLYEIQTPQAFCYKKLWCAYCECSDIAAFTDDSSLFAAAGHKITLLNGLAQNIKITSPAHIFGIMDCNFSIGLGFDVHKLVQGRPLILGGESISFERGLLGHSDADVLTHAIMDSLLSSAGLKDIGTQFPDTDSSYKDANSIELLKKVLKLCLTRGFAPHSVSAVIICQKPKLAPYMDSMRQNLGNLLGCNLSLSATTTEGLGLIGSGDAIAASAVCISKRLI